MIRTGAQQFIRIWIEPAIALFLLTLLAIYLLSGTRISGGFLAICLLVGAGLALWSVNAIARARLTAASDGAGVVLVDEGRIGHFGVESGGFVDIDELQSVRLMGAGKERHWVLLHGNGPDMKIPVSAKDADQLVDFLASLNGMSTLRVSKAVHGTTTETIWERAR